MNNAERNKAIIELLDKHTKELIAQGPEACREYLRSIGVRDKYYDTGCPYCGEPTEWVNHTQFSGDHEFCDKHAREHKDFDDADSTYSCWIKL